MGCAWCADSFLCGADISRLHYVPLEMTQVVVPFARDGKAHRGIRYNLNGATYVTPVARKRKAQLDGAMAEP